MSERLGAAARALLGERLAARDESLLPFARAVAWQVAHPLGATGEWAADGLDDDATREGRERAAAERLGALLADARRDVAAETRERAAVELGRDAALLSACYQNLDLLPPGDAGDAVAMLVARALEGSGRDGESQGTGTRDQ